MKKAIIHIIFILISTHFWAQKHDVISLKMKTLDSCLTIQDKKILTKLTHELYSLDTILPDKAAFYLGYVLYQNKYYYQSLDALLRYIDLTKENGEAFDSCKKIINLNDVALKQYDTNNCSICHILGPLDIIDTCGVCLGKGHNIQECSRCDGVGKETCPRCLGTGFDRFNDGFQTNFVPCMLCNQQGSIECQRCNGTKVEKVICKKCSGRGTHQRDRECTHRDLKGAPIHHKDIHKRKN